MTTWQRRSSSTVIHLPAHSQDQTASISNWIYLLSSSISSFSVIFNSLMHLSARVFIEMKISLLISSAVRAFVDFEWTRFMQEDACSEGTPFAITINSRSVIEDCSGHDTLEEAQNNDGLSATFQTLLVRWNYPVGARKMNHCSKRLRPPSSVLLYVLHTFWIWNWFFSVIRYSYWSSCKKKATTWIGFICCSICALKSHPAWRIKEHTHRLCKIFLSFWNSKKAWMYLNSSVKHICQWSGVWLWRFS